MSNPDDRNAIPEYPESGSRQPPQSAGQSQTGPYQLPGQTYPRPVHGPAAPPPYQPPYQPPGQGYPPPGPSGPPAQPPQYQAPSGATDAERNLARKRVEARRALGGHAVAYLVVNLFLVVVWAFSGGGYFWPIWVLAGWGVGLVLNTWDVLFRRPVTEDDIEREMRRGRGAR